MKRRLLSAWGYGVFVPNVWREKNRIYTIRPDSGCTLAVMAITGLNQTASRSDPDWSGVGVGVKGLEDGGGGRAVTCRFSVREDVAGWEEGELEPGTAAAAACHPVSILLGDKQRYLIPALRQSVFDSSW